MLIIGTLPLNYVLIYNLLMQMLLGLSARTAKAYPKQLLERNVNLMNIKSSMRKILV